MTSSTQLQSWINQLDLRDIEQEVAASYGVALHRLNRIAPQKHAQDVLNPRKVEEKMRVLEGFTGPVQGKSMLEIGSGYGMFIAVTRLHYGMDSFGIEPSGPGYESSLLISRRLMQRCGLDPRIIVEGF